jgi:hypothetical protein
MKNPIFLTIVCFVFCGLITGSAFAQKELLGMHIEKPPHLDGVLEKEVWSNVPKAMDFVSQLPVPGLTMIEKTEVQVAYTHEAMYIGFNCLDTHQIRY